MEIALKDGRTVDHHVPHAYGTMQNPMDTETVNAKTRALLVPVLGSQRSEAVIAAVNDLENLPSVRDLIPSLALDSSEMTGLVFAH